jgi:hypothetical protein
MQEDVWDMLNAYYTYALLWLMGARRRRRSAPDVCAKISRGGGAGSPRGQRASAIEAEAT